jgi:hypothetical protein
VGTVFQSDGASPRFSRHVRDFLDTDFPDRWTGRGEPSFFRLDSWIFFSRGFAKDTLYREKVQNVKELRDRIVRAADCVTNEMRGTEHRLDACRATDGAHIELY